MDILYAVNKMLLIFIMIVRGLDIYFNKFDYKKIKQNMILLCLIIVFIGISEDYSLLSIYLYSIFYMYKNIRNGV